MDDSAKRMGELLLPGSVVGVIAAIAVGGVALLGGLPAGYVAVAALAIGVPLSLFGAGYNFLLAKARIRLGGITPAVGYWLVGYTVSRTVHELAIDAYAGRPLGFSEGLLAFIAFQLLVSVGFAVGFMWLHEHAAPSWWMRIRDRNPVAAAYVAAYMEQAAYTEQQKQKGKRERAAKQRNAPRSSPKKARARS